MTLDELKADLRAILAEEEQQQVDWGRVQLLCLGTIGRLATEPEPSYAHEVVYHFLDDADIREKGTVYAERQRERLRAWLDPALQQVR
ncbi:hypothetical protein E2493_03275 [Sphingomonas parva]|uniref:Uncharacterized protein n=1 Tax=Sphingomonas parva TaxID=2555898 RepID=A0A4Y8ZUR2_9SPHN|nr:hypothetical protein [Sphingomonas parva]TFI59654.1 hypothetical protein E2493_03275 [Sphingomonas parva]